MLPSREKGAQLSSEGRRIRAWQGAAAWSYPLGVKNQYVGDVNDYRKYGLLRALESAGVGDWLVAWMLTPDDGSADGRRTRYLDRPKMWSQFDPELFSSLSHLMNGDLTREVSLVENSGLLPSMRFFSTLVPDAAGQRATWARQMSKCAEACSCVFFDPDNGLEINSRPIGRLGSSKYVAWREAEQVWKQGASVLIYQHFPRVERSRFIDLRLAEIRARLDGADAIGFRTANVVFLLAAQPDHAHRLSSAATRASAAWHGQIEVVRPR